MLSEAQKKHLIQLFNDLDRDHDGLLNRGDLEPLAAQFTMPRTGQADMQPVVRQNSLALELWGQLERLAAFEDAQNAPMGYVSLTRWLNLYQVLWDTHTHLAALLDLAHLELASGNAPKTITPNLTGSDMQ